MIYIFFRVFFCGLCHRTFFPPKVSTFLCLLFELLAIDYLNIVPIVRGLKSIEVNDIILTHQGHVNSIYIQIVKLLLTTTTNFINKYLLPCIQLYQLYTKEYFTDLFQSLIRAFLQEIKLKLLFHNFH